jgi:PAP2 superfamily protein
MPSLHVAWAAWCAAALVAATRSRWRHLAWLYPAATTFVVLATANHFLADAATGLAVTALGLLAARVRTRPDAWTCSSSESSPRTANHQDQAITAHRDSQDQAGKGGSWGQRG